MGWGRRDSGLEVITTTPYPAAPVVEAPILSAGDGRVRLGAARCLVLVCGVDGKTADDAQKTCDIEIGKGFSNQ